MKQIDLHIHTTASDGSFSSKEVVDKALKRGVEIIAITDHNSISGISKAVEYARGKDIKVIPGIEINCQDSEFELKNVHILGLFINYHDKELLRIVRREKKNILVRILRRVIHFFKINKIKPLGFFRKRIPIETKISVKEAIKAIDRSGGISIIAHPGLYGEKMMKIIEKFIKLGGDGIEIDYLYDKIYFLDNDTKKKLKDKLTKLAREKNLVISGGSDFHGGNRNIFIGDAGIDKKEFLLMKKKLEFKRNNK
jgi:hypothetical protein